MLIGGCSMRKRAEVSTVAIVNPSKPLGNFLFGFSRSGEGLVRVACDALYALPFLLQGIFSFS